MKFFTLLTVLFCAVFSHAQDVKGYYITESGKTVNGFFEDGDFNNHQGLKFKETRSAAAQNLPQDIVAYGIEDLNLKYEKHPVKIDVSTKNSRYKDPVWETKTLFLNVIVSGTASLYSYTKDYEMKFFYKTKDKPEIEQLINKKYFATDTETAVNKAYRQQLYNAVNCKNKKASSDFIELIYDKTVLTNLFVEYNECVGSESNVYITIRESAFKFTAYAGVNSTTFGVTYAERVPEEGNDINFAVGAEVAYRFPSQASEFFFRAEYETINGKIQGRIDQGYNHVISTYDFSGSAINAYLGYRHNFALSHRNKLFLEGAFCMSIPSGDVDQNTLVYPASGIDPYPETSYDYAWDMGFCMDFGIGYVFDDKYGISLRYATRKDFLDDVYSYYKTEISRLGLNLRYTIN